MAYLKPPSVNDKRFFEIEVVEDFETFFRYRSFERIIEQQGGKLFISRKKFQLVFAGPELESGKIILTKSSQLYKDGYIKGSRAYKLNNRINQAVKSIVFENGEYRHVEPPGYFGYDNICYMLYNKVYPIPYRNVPKVKSSRKII